MMNTAKRRLKTKYLIWLVLLPMLFSMGCSKAKTVPIDYAAYGRTDIFRVGNRAYEKCVYNESTAAKYAELVGEASEALSGETKVYSLIIPTAYGIILPEEAKKLVPDYIDTHERISKVYAAMPESVNKIAVWNRLVEYSDEFIYFRTDHHWTARGAYLGYDAFCEAKDIDPIPLSDHLTVSYEGFLGSFYTESGGDEKLLPSETVEAFYPVSEGVTLTVTDENGITEDRPIVADVSGLPASAKYMTFAGGNNPFSVITNTEVTDGSVLIVVKESFGNPMLAFLCGHYSTVYVIDYRYWDGNLIDFAKEVYADDLLFANSFCAVNTGSNVGFLAMIIKNFV